MIKRSNVEITASEIKVSVQGIPIYFIEITTKTSQVVCDYIERGLWEDILGGMAEVRMFDERMGEVKD